MDTCANEQLERFREYRPLLFSIAYRMLGSVADAEDVVQEAYLRWRQVDSTSVRSAKDYLSAIVTRLSIDHLRSARAQREVYVGPWLPEPLVGVGYSDPLEGVVLAESLSMAFLLLLERLTPVQRAAFLLREVFNYEYPDIARILETSEANCRQLVRRARARLAGGRGRFVPNPAEAEAIVRQFLDACLGGDLEGLVSRLAEDATAWSDGGGRVAAARQPIRGAVRVARFLAGLARKWSRVGGEFQVVAVNGNLGLLACIDGRTRGVVTVALAAGRVQDVFIVVNPDKLPAS